MSVIGWTKTEQAQQVANLLPTGGIINLGVGLPVMVAAAISPEQEIVLHCENGLIGYRALDVDETVDADIIDARCEPIQLEAGASVVAHDLSFAIARGGRLDATILGAFQVAANGDLANWSGGQGRLAGVGGAMDLAVGAKQVIVMMRHLDKQGQAKIVDECSLPLTAKGCVTRIVTEMAVIAVLPDGLLVEKLAPGVTAEALQAATEPSLKFAKSE